MLKKTIEIPIEVYNELINEHLINQAPEATQTERDKLIETYIQVMQERYWEEEDV